MEDGASTDRASVENPNPENTVWEIRPNIISHVQIVDEEQLNILIDIINIYNQAIANRQLLAIDEPIIEHEPMESVINRLLALDPNKFPHSIVFKVNIILENGRNIWRNLTLERIRKFIKYYSEMLEIGLELMEKVEFGSNSEIDHQFVEVCGLEIHIGKYNSQAGGRFAGYFNIIEPLISFELNKLQIFNRKNKTSKVHCLVYALSQFETIDSSCLQEINDLIQNNAYPRNLLSVIARIIKHDINLTFHDGNRIDKHTFLSGYLQFVNIGLINNHYFSNHEIKGISWYSLKHYDKIKHLKDWNHIIEKNGKYWKRSKKCSITSVGLMLQCMKNNWFTHVKTNNLKVKDSRVTLRDLELGQVYEPIASFDFGFKSGLSTEYIRVIRKKNESKHDKIAYRDVIFADIEAVSIDLHVPIVVCSYSTMKLMRKDVFVSEFNSNNEMIENCIVLFLDQIPSNSIVYFHNLKYDFSLLLKELKIKKTIEMNNNLYSVTCDYKNKTIEFRDSLKMINCALRKFGSMFDLNINKGDVDFNEINARYLNGTLDSIMDDIVKYCKRDVLVLMKGFEKFSINLYNTYKITAYQKLSISGVADLYLINNKAYDNCILISGIAQTFIQNSIFGGRTCSLWNLQYIIEDEIDLIDAVSLYPSAIVRLKGIPMGNPNILCDNKNTLKFIDSYYSYSRVNVLDKYVSHNTIKYKEHDSVSYYIKFKIISVGVDLPIPTYYVKNKDGNCEWGANAVDKVLTMDMFTFEESVIRHEMTVLPLEIIYFTGVNNGASLLTRNLFNNRLTYKTSGNKCMDSVCKMLLVSIYGKSIIKRNEHKVQYREIDNINEYMLSNSFYVSTLDELENKQCRISFNYFDFEHVNKNYFGSLILGMSKRIMNEVIYCKIPIQETLDDKYKHVYKQVGDNKRYPLVFSGDTDSLHVLKRDLPLLIDSYKKEYNRDLIGKQMGQFHSDFEDIDEETIDKVGVKEVFMSPKTYCILVKYTLKDGSCIFKEQYRFKGINSTALKTHCNLKNVSIMDWYCQNNLDVVDLCNTNNKIQLKNFKSKTIKTFKRTTNLRHKDSIFIV